LTRFALHVIEEYTGYLMGKRILVADDSRTIQQAFAMVMDGSGYTLGFARSVDEALAVARRDGRPDLVLSDAALGSGSGYDLCAQLKAEAALRDVPVYILASTQNPYDEARGRKVGADGHLAKPFESQALLDAVASALAAPVARPSSSMPARSADLGGGGAGYSDDVAVEDEDSYGEITIERGPVSAPGAASWASKPAPRPSAAHSSQAATPAVPTATRAPMIPSARPSAAMPAARTGATPQPVAGLPAPSAPRAPARTMMGFPSVKQPAAPVAPTPSRSPALPPATAAAPRSPAFATPGTPAAPVSARPTPPPPSLPGPVPGFAARPVVPRFVPPPSPPSPPAPPAAQAQPSTRRALTPPPPAAPVPLSSVPPAGVASISNLIDQKVAAIAERGPEYAAIAKLSREIIEQVVWEVVPELAEVIIRQEVDRLASAKK
jgi:CheY-like chemotaxis protein